MHVTQFDVDRLKALEIASVTNLREDQAFRYVHDTRIIRARTARRLQASNWIK